MALFAVCYPKVRPYRLHKFTKHLLLVLVLGVTTLYDMPEFFQMSIIYINVTEPQRTAGCYAPKFNAAAWQPPVPDPAGANS
jgi:hypothetical protein